MTLVRNVLIDGRWYGPAYPAAGDPPAGRAEHAAARGTSAARSTAARPRSRSTAPTMRKSATSTTGSSDDLLSKGSDGGPLTTGDTPPPSSPPADPGAERDVEPPASQTRPRVESPVMVAGDSTVAEPVPASPEVPEPPPRHGKGSTNAAWRAWAQRAGLEVPGDSTRDAVLAAALDAGLIRSA